MKSSPPARKSKDVWLIVLSALDVITGVLSLVFTALAIQVIAVMASGLTLMKAVKVAIQSEKTAIFVKPVAVYAVRKITRSEKMKSFFGKIKENIKNNPVTLVTVIVELAICSLLGYTSLDIVSGFAWAEGWKAYALAFGAALVIYGVLVALTVYLGHDNAVFAFIRKAAKLIGGEKVAEAVNATVEEVKEAVDAANREALEKAEAERIAAEAEAEKKAEEERIYLYALEQEEKKKAQVEAARRAQLVNAYSAEFRRKQAEEAVNVAQEANPVTEVVNDVNTHNI